MSVRSGIQGEMATVRRDVAMMNQGLNIAGERFSDYSD